MLLLESRGGITRATAGYLTCDHQVCLTLAGSPCCFFQPFWTKPPPFEQEAPHFNNGGIPLSGRSGLLVIHFPLQGPFLSGRWGQPAIACCSKRSPFLKCYWPTPMGWGCHIHHVAKPARPDSAWSSSRQMTPLQPAQQGATYMEGFRSRSREKTQVSRDSSNIWNIHKLEIENP